MDQTAWRRAYRDWLDRVGPLLERKEYAEAFRTYPWLEAGQPPFAVPKKKLSDMTVALLTSGGLSTPGQTPFDEANPLGDPTYRWIGRQGPLPEWRVDHGHYDPSEAKEDYNTIFPLDALRALERDRVIGAVASRHASFVGYQPDVLSFIEGSGRQIADGLAAGGVDAVLLVPV